MLKKIADFIYDLTLGLVKQYQSTAVDLAKIEAAAFYLRLVKALREHFVSLVVLLFCLMTAAFGIISIPLAIVLCLELTLKTKILLLVLLGVLYICVPLAVANRYLSEKAWITGTKSDEVLKKVLQ